MKSYLALAIIFLSVSACRLSTKAEQFVYSINSQGNSHYGTINLVKDPTKRRGYIVVYDAADGNYYAVELYGNRHFFRRDENPLTFYLNNRIQVSYDKNGYWKDGQGRLYEKSAATSKDLEKMGAVNETVQIAQSAQFITEQFGLSEVRSTALAKLSLNLGKIQQKRSLTSADYQAVGQELLGTDLAKFAQEYAKNQMGENSSYSELLEQAAQLNDISPEHMQNLIETVVNQ